MKVLLSVIQIVFNVLKDILLSSWYTAKLILQKPETVKSGVTEFAYGELEPGLTSLLATLISLTPGTTTIEIDLENRKLLLHLLDLEHRDETLASIHHDFVLPLRNLSGGHK
jgi:multisubunit Na+/H+ antiporter MnhE subunit